MRTIWKYILADEVEIPVGAKLIKLGYQKLKQEWVIVGWFYIHNKESKLTDMRQYFIFNTGQRVTRKSNYYLGTVILPNGGVKHIFE